MTRAVLSALVSLTLVCPLLAQKPIVPPTEAPIPEPSSKLKSNQYQVAIKGCIRNKRLLLSEREINDLEFAALRASEFILDGPKELLRQIVEQHSGHYDEVDGVVTVPASPSGATTAVTTKKLGPVRVGMGTRQDSGTSPAVDVPRPLTIRVALLTHLSEGCFDRH